MSPREFDIAIMNLKRRLKCLSCEDVEINAQIQDILDRLTILEEGGGGDLTEILQRLDDLEAAVSIIEGDITTINSTLLTKADLVLGVVPLAQLPVQTFTTYVNTYADLPAANTVTGQKYGVINSQGTNWLPGTLGGTYYSKGYYYSDGAVWIFMGSFPFQATQSDVNAGIITDQFVSPATFEGASKWSTHNQAWSTIISTPTTLSGYGITDAIDGSGTTNQLSYWVDSNTLGSLTTATYPSLTELSYIKGLTSAIQTQLNNKWGNTGNAGTIAGANFIGTIDDIDFVIKRNNQSAARFYENSLSLIAAGTAPYGSFFLGSNSGSAATNALYSNFLGSNSGNAATNASNSNLFGFNSGYQATNASYSNFIGANTGFQATNASYSNLFGYQVGYSFISNNIGSNNIIIGTNISLPNATANAINLGGVLFGTGTYATTTGNPSIIGSSGGKIGILTPTPTSTFSVGASSQFQVDSLGAIAAALSLTLTGNISSTAWTTNGIRIRGISSTFTDTSSSGTVATAYTNVLGGNTIAASNSTTFTNYITTFLRDPVAGSLVTFTNKYALGAESAIFGTSNQVAISNAGIITANSLTASLLIATDASKNLVSLATATYPSLTELSYVKGVTSAIQTQLNTKAATLSGTNNEIAYFNSSSTIASLAVSTYPNLTELSYVKGVTSAIQTQINALPAASSTTTFTNKRITKRTGTTTSSATPTINTDNVDMYLITAQTADITSFTTNLSGTPTEGQTLWIVITGTAARAITWGTSFEASTIALPTTTVSTNRLDIGFVWNSVTSKWRCIASA